MKKKYSKINNIELKHVDIKPTFGTLVLEGGAFRGLYTAGVLDCLLDNGILIQNAIGISAGALNGANYLSGSRGRTAYCVLKHRYNKRYVGLKAFKESGSIVGFRFMFEDLNKDLKLDEEKLFNNNLIVGCCNVASGETEYIKVDNHDIMEKAVKASASMPMVSKMVEINGNKYLDGGVNEKLPIRYAIDNNYSKIIFIGTRPIEYRRGPKPKEYKIEKIMYRKYPNLLVSMLNANKKYNNDVEYIEELTKQNKILCITPSKTIRVKRLEKNLEKLGQLYELGYNDGLRNLEKIKKYLYID